MRCVKIAALLLSVVILAGQGVAGVPQRKDVGPPQGEASASRAVKAARTTSIPRCTAFVDAASTKSDGTAQAPHKTIAAAIEAAQEGAVICVAQGNYAEQLKPGEKGFTLAGGFQSGKGFKVRDSAAYVSRAKGNGSGSFLRIDDPGPKGDQLTAIDGFEISGYSQAIVREFYESQRFDITNNSIHDNVCTDVALAGAGFALHNITGTIRGNVIARNRCGRGGAGFLNDAVNKNTVTIENNLVDANAGTEPDAAHGGGLYLFGNTLNITGNLLTNNTITQWGGGLYIGAFTPGNQPTTATLRGNVYRGNRAGDSGGGFFCDDGATCIASHEIYDRNCGGNILVDGGAGGSGPTTARFDHITSVGALGAGCAGPGTGLFVDTYEALAPDSYSITNAIFWGNAEGQDLAVSCGSGCSQLKVSVTSSMVQTKYGDGSIKIALGAGNVAPADPLFAASGNGDFRLQPGSPAIGKGTKGSNLGADGPGGEAPAALRNDTVGNDNPEGSESSESPGSSTTSDRPANSGSIALLRGSSGRAEVESGSATTPAQTTEPVPPAPAPAADPAAKDAFEAAKELGTVTAWNAFLKSYPTGFHANLARAYLTKLEDGDATPEPAAGPGAKTAGEPPPSNTAKPAVARGGKYMGFPEKFNRYYTDLAWKASKTIYVSPNGEGDGTTREAPMAAADAVAAAQPGTMIYFLQGAYEGGLEFSKDTSGTFDAPIVLYAERSAEKSISVTMNCAVGNRQSCFNFEGANYIAADGFEFIGGKYGVRAVGLGFPASEHSRGMAVLNCKGRDQNNDPFKSAQSDWNVWERNIGYGAKKGDGHGLYISGGSDWNIVRFNETFANESSDFQINADPASSCLEVGIPFADPRCDAYAGEGEGGQGASDYMLVDGNYFHHGIGPGANFTSVRRSVIRNNIFGLHATKHNVSFWQETDNPKLGSSDNKILHNLFITTGRHGIQFVNHSTRNEFVNNVILGVTVNGGKVTANPSALLMEVDDTVSENVYRSNLYIAGKMEGRSANDTETARKDFSASWFAKFPAARNTDANDFTPAAQAPFLAMGKLTTDAPFDRNGAKRSGNVDLGPIEVP